MRKLVRTFILTAAAAATLASTAASAAVTTIDTTSFWNGTATVGALGSPSTGVFGQTFTAPDTAIKSFTFFIDDGGSKIDVFGAVYAWTGNLIAGNGPQGATGPALFTSAVFKTAGVDGLTALTVDTGSTTLVAGQNYVVLLAALSSQQGEAFFGIVDPNPGVASDGGFNYFNNDFFLPIINNGNWDSGLDYGTLAWVGEFGTAAVVPEPQSWALMLIGFGAMGVVMRRKTVVAAA